MKRFLYRTLAAMLIFVLLQTAAFGAYTAPEGLETRSLEELMTEFMENRGLHEDNFSISYYNTVTEETYTFNDKKFMVAASTFKLPLNMYYYEMERDGEIQPDAYIPRAGMNLNDCHRLSLVWSDNPVSIGMLYNLGTFRQYKECMKKYFTMPEDQIDYIYYVDNYYCVHMMMDALKYLYNHAEDFEEMLGYMKEAQPDSWFRTYVTDWPVAHKYGYFEGAVNDTGIFYTEEPFLLAVYTQGTAESVVAEAAALLTDYNVTHTAPPEPEPEPEPEIPDTAIAVTPTIEPLPEPELEIPPVMQETPPEEEPEELPAAETESTFVWWMIPVALGVFVLGSSVVLLCVAFGKKGGKYARRWDDRLKKS